MFAHNVIVDDIDKVVLFLAMTIVHVGNIVCLFLMHFDAFIYAVICRRFRCSHESFSPSTHPTHHTGTTRMADPPPSSMSLQLSLSESLADGIHGITAAFLRTFAPPPFLVAAILFQHGVFIKELRTTSSSPPSRTPSAACMRIR